MEVSDTINSQGAGFRLYDWEQGKKPGPWRMTVFPTWHCNLKCKICEKTWGGNPREQFNQMPEERWLEIVDEAAAMGVKQITIGGGGEPLLRHDLILDMCERIRKHGIFGQLQTNGTRFKEGAIKRLVDAKWNSLCISIDGPTAEINDRVRYQKNFERVMAAIEELNRCKRDANTLYPTLQIVTVVTKYTADDLRQMVNLAHELGAQNIHFLSLLTYNEHIAEFALTDKQKAELPTKAREALERADELKMFTNLADFFDGSYAAQKFEYPEPCEADTQIQLVESTCFEPWLSLQILPSGLIAPCCVFWDDDADSVRNTSLQKIWHGAYLSKMRQHFLQNRPHPSCAKCELNNIRDNAVNRNIYQEVRSEPLKFSMRPDNLLRKATNSLKQYGVLNSIRRGNEWLKLRSFYHK